MNVLSILPNLIFVFAIFTISCLPLTYVLFNNFKQKKNVLELSLLSFLISLVLIPLLVWLSTFVISFSLLSVLGCIVLLFLISLIIYKYSAVVSPDSNFLNISKYHICLILILLFAFFIRLQTLSSFYYEFDPYWYGEITQFLINDGSIPVYDDLAYVADDFAAGKGHRTLTQPHFLTSIFFVLIEGETYSNTINSFIMNLYPPILGVLICFVAYFLFKEMYGEHLGLVAAIIFSVAPVLIQRFMSGGAEQLPWGLAFGFFGIVFLYFASIFKDRKMYIPYIIMVVGSMLGSKAGMIPLVIGVFYLSILSVKNFIDKTPEKRNYEILGLLFGTLLVLTMIHYSYINVNFINALSDVRLLFVLIGFVFCLIFYYMSDIFTFIKSKFNFNITELQLISSVVVITLLFLFTLGYPITQYLIETAQVGLIEESALMKTVAEESLAAGKLTAMLGYYGLSIDIYKFTNPILGQYGSLDALPIIFIALVLLLVYVFKTNNKSLNFKLCLLLMLFIFSISVIGLQKIKYTAYLGLILPLSFILITGEVIKHYDNKVKDTDEINITQLLFSVILFILIGIIAYALLFHLFGIFNLITGKGGIPYLSSTTNEIGYLFAGVLLLTLFFIYKKYKEQNYSLTFSLILLLITLPYLLSYVELIPYFIAQNRIDATNYTEVIEFCNYASKQNIALGYLYCQVMPPYWHDAMMFIRDKTPKDSRILSWWDYGHWTNFFGERSTVIRNDHPSGGYENERVADKFVANDIEALKEYMQITNSSYVMFDQDLIGKWGALTYLSCVYNNETSNYELPSQSVCSMDYQFERIYIPVNPDLNERCMIEEQFGTIAYSSFDQRVYCSMNGVLYNIETNQPYLASPVFMSAQNIQNRQFNEYLVIYFGTDIDKAPGRGYKSIFYKAFFLGELEGFTQVYPVSVGPGIYPVRIYQVDD